MPPLLVARNDGAAHARLLGALRDAVFDPVVRARPFTSGLPGAALLHPGRRAHRLLGVGDVHKAGTGDAGEPPLDRGAGVAGCVGTEPVGGAATVHGENFAFAPGPEGSA